MRLHDPGRPHIGLTPALVGPDGKSRGAVIPRLDISFNTLEDGTTNFEVVAFAAFNGNTGRYYYARNLDAPQLADLCAAWADSPETALEERFGWRWEGGQSTILGEVNQPRGEAPAPTGKTSQEMGL